MTASHFNVIIRSVEVAADGLLGADTITEAILIMGEGREDRVVVSGARAPYAEGCYHRACLVCGRAWTDNSRVSKVCSPECRVIRANQTRAKRLKRRSGIK